MIRLTLSLLSLAVILTLIPLNSSAATLKNIPSKEYSKQWEVVVGKADSDEPKLNKSSKPDLYSVFSLDVKNIGDENIKLIRVEAYRDEPNSTTQYELFTVDYEDEQALYPSFHHHNFPLYTKAKELKVIITWTKKSEKNDHQRKFREQFVFQQ